MMKTDKLIMLVLIIFDAAAILVGMVAGPLSHTALSIGASVSAAVISLAIIIFGLTAWKKPKRF